MNDDNQEALIIIDVQKGFDDPIMGVRNNLDAEENISLLLKFWRDKRLPIVHIQHLSTSPTSVFRPGQEGCEFKLEARPLDEEVIFTKSVNSAFIGTQLEKYLRDNSISKVVFVGLTTDHCVSTSVRMAANLGFQVKVVTDATATFNRIGVKGEVLAAEKVHEFALASLNEEFSILKNTKELLACVSNNAGSNSRHEKSR